MQSLELRVIVGALLTGNATIAAEEKGTRELHLLSIIYGIVLMKLQKSSVAAADKQVVKRVVGPPFEIEALVEQMRWFDGLYELTFRRNDGTQPLDVEKCHLDAIEEPLEFYIKDVHSGVKTGKYSAKFEKAIQKGLAALKERKHSWKESSLEEDDGDVDEDDDDLTHKEL